MSLSERTMDVVGSQCLLCTRRVPGVLGVCEAFPSEIPVEIGLNIHDHRRPWVDPETGEPGDLGVAGGGSLLFKPRPEVAPQAIANLAAFFARPRV